MSASEDGGELVPEDGSGIYFLCESATDHHARENSGGLRPEFDTFVETMDLLRENLGVILLQFPYLDKWQMEDRHAFTDRLLPFLKTLPRERQFAVEIRYANNHYAAFRIYAELSLLANRVSSR